MFEVITPAASRALLTASELRAAAGLAADDESQDARLADLGARVADTIARFCRVADDGVNPPSLLSEVCAETLRFREGRSAIVLRRRFITAVAAVSEDGVGLGAGSWQINKASGILERIRNDRVIAWSASKIVVQYSAGFATVPSDLKQASEMFLRQMHSQMTRDPLVRRERTDGVGDVEYWVGSIDAANGAPFPSDVASLLTPYVNYIL